MGFSIWTLLAVEFLLYLYILIIVIIITIGISVSLIRQPVFESEYVKALQHKVRYATEADSPSLITHWLAIDTCRLQGFEHRKQHYERQFRLLLDTIADELLPGHWRNCCLDNIYRPLAELNRLSSRPDHQSYIYHLRYELNMTCHYVLHGLTH
ncbi:MAG: hypothetical protein CSA60_01275 [Neptuniibacter caesariensis]|uniref:Uncharacterized protein n=1 Tax=Neptuniibacter caesariensis TaxID=207954 RepID=A0A2G6JP01_NEPCE|nr:MAG: hypothetical protein CSA60_01275 [Neptuniibacter caesariensis]